MEVDVEPAYRPIPPKIRRHVAYLGTQALPRCEFPRTADRMLGKPTRLRCPKNERSCAPGWPQVAVNQGRTKRVEMGCDLLDFSALGGCRLR